MDTVNKATRSRIMSSIGQRNTVPEIRLRHELHKRGFRYSLHCRTLPGSPDLVFPRLRAVIFVHGCFWHAHGCRKRTIPSTRKGFWKDKFEANIRRDKRKIDLLLADGWRVSIVWECILKEKRTYRFDKTIGSIGKWLDSKKKFKEFGGFSI